MSYRTESKSLAYCENKNGVSLRVKVPHHTQKYTLTVARLPKIHTQHTKHTKLQVQLSTSTSVHYCVKYKVLPPCREGLPLSNTIRVLMILLKGNKILHLITLAIWRWHPDLNRGMRVLQTLALPLGYATNLSKRKSESEFCRLVPYRLAMSPYFKNGAVLKAPLERMTRLELATSTLARLRSTR